MKNKIQIQLTDQNIDIFSNIQRFIYRIFRIDNKKFIYQLAEEYFNKLLGDKNINLEFNKDENLIILNNIGDFRIGHEMFKMIIYLNKKINSCVDYYKIDMASIETLVPLKYKNVNIFILEYVFI